ncbi:MAG: hypothetical protein A2X86_12140 [Bdellovibrionales bacterium GWA2_49_15]|nr:MAG: hypothetical protein A2X86_12140 [Bdellovibrionales bacterium GWA2_49_15]
MWQKLKKLVFLPYHLEEFSVQQVFRLSFLFLAFFHIYAALMSEGFHRPDEHLGMIRMVLYKLGKLEASQLSWEFPVQIRSWAQPYFYVAIAKIYGQLGAANPFILATLFRLSSSLLALTALFWFMRTTTTLFEKDADKKLSLSLFPFIWYLPFFHARTSTENFSSSLTLFAIAGLIYLHKKTVRVCLLPFIIGLCMAFAFYFRLQMATSLLPALIPFVFFQKQQWKTAIIIIAGGLCGLGLNVLIDYQGYGNWVFSPWNNVYQNVFKGMASSFGTDPFYTYFSKSFLRGIPPISLFFLAIPLIYWFKRPKCILTWVSLPFLMAHSCLAHKELRFIFFLGQLIPPMAPIFVAWCKSLPGIRTSYVNSFHYVAKLALILSLVLSLASSSRDAYSHMGFYKFLYHLKPVPQKIYTLNVVRDVLEFYLPGPVEFVYSPNFTSSAESAYVLTDSYADMLHLTTHSHCLEVYSEYSVFFQSLLQKIAKSKDWAVLQCPASAHNL